MMSEWEVGVKKRDLDDILHSAIYNFDNKAFPTFVQITWKISLKFDHYFINSLLYYNIPNFLHVNIGWRGGAKDIQKSQNKISDINYQ